MVEPNLSEVYGFEREAGFDRSQLAGITRVEWKPGRSPQIHSRVMGVDYRLTLGFLPAHLKMDAGRNGELVARIIVRLSEAAQVSEFSEAKRPGGGYVWLRKGAM